MIYVDSDMSKSTNTVVYFDWKTVIYTYACENVAHNLCNSNNTAPSIGIFRVTIYAANGNVSLFIGGCANEIIRRHNSGFFLSKGKE